MDKQVARFIYSENVSFRSVEGSEFVKMCQILRPGYKPPDRRKLAGPLLETIYEEVDASAVKAVEDSSTYLVLSQDGWSSQSNDPIIAHCFTDGKQIYLHSLVDAGSTKKTAEYCFELLDTAIKEIEEKYKKPVYGIVTDNENKMKRVRQLVLQKYPDKIVYGCSAHYESLLQDDVKTDAILKHVVAVNSYFRNNHRAHGMLKERGGVMPQLPNKTRWQSQEGALNSFKTNHPIYVAIRTEMINEGEDMPKNIAKLVDNIGLAREAFNLCGQMKVYGEALDKFQSDSCKISDATHVWNELLQKEVNNLINKSKS